jgi:hypothetical protein
LSTVNSTIAPSLFSHPCRTLVKSLNSKCQLPIISELSSTAASQLIRYYLFSINNLAGLVSSLYSLGADPTENTVSNSSFIVVMGGYLAIARILLTSLPAVTKQHPLPRCSLRGPYPATGLYATILSNLLCSLANMYGSHGC